MGFLLNCLSFLETTWLMQVKVPKSILIDNWRLALVLRLMQIGIMAWFIVVMVFGTGDVFMVQLVPIFSSRLWVEDDPATTSRREQAEADSSLCDPEYLKLLKYKSDHLHHFAPQGCIRPLPGDWWEKGDKSVFIPTYMTETLREQTSGIEDCKRLQAACQGPRQVFHAAVDTAQNGAAICDCDTGSEFFIRGVGGLKIAIDSEFRVLEKTGGKTKVRGNTRDRENLRIYFQKPELQTAEQVHKKNIVGNQLGTRKSALEIEDLGDMTEEEIRLEKAQAQRSQRMRSTHDARGRVARAVRGRRVGAIGKFGSGGRGAVLVAPDGGFTVATESVESSGRLMRREILKSGSVMEARSYNESQKASQNKSLGVENHRQGAAVEEADDDDNLDLMRELKSNERLSLELEEWLKYALLVNGGGTMEPLFLQARRVFKDTGSYLDMANNAVKKSPIRPPLRMTGMELRITLEYSNEVPPDSGRHPKDVGKEINVYKIRVEAVPSWNVRPRTYHLEPRDIVTGKAKTVTRMSYGIVVRINEKGAYKQWYLNKVTQLFSSMIVVFQIPEILVGGVALYFLSFASNFYYYVSNERVRMKRSLVGTMARAIGWNYLFKLEVSNHYETSRSKKNTAEPGDDLLQNIQKKMPAFNAALLRSDIRDAFGHDAEVGVTEAPVVDDESTKPFDNFAHMVVDDIGSLKKDKGDIEDINNSTISACDFARAATGDDIFSIAEFAEVYADREWSMVEKMFLPPDELEMGKSDESWSTNEAENKLTGALAQPRTMDEPIPLTQPILPDYTIKADPIEDTGIIAPLLEPITELAAMLEFRRPREPTSRPTDDVSANLRDAAQAEESPAVGTADVGAAQEGTAAGIEADGVVGDGAAVPEIAAIGAAVPEAAASEAGTRPIQEA